MQGRHGLYHTTETANVEKGARRCDENCKKSNIIFLIFAVLRQTQKIDVCQPTVLNKLPEKNWPISIHMIVL